MSRLARLAPLAALALAACAPPAPPAPVPPAAGFAFVDLTDDFARFAEDSAALSGEARVTAFKQHFQPLLPGFYNRTKVGPYDYGMLILKALDSYPSQRADIAQVSQRFAAMAVPARTRFEALFGPIGTLPPVVLLHSLGEMDGGVRTLPATGRTLIFGADMIARLHLARGVEPFVHHELFHVFHERRFAGCAALWCDLWTEGLAVYAAERLNPGASDSQLLLTEPRPLRPAVEAHREDAFALLLARLDSTETSGWFSSGTLTDTLPARSGYYLGYLVAREAGRTHSPQRLAAMTVDEARPMVRGIVERLAAEARQTP